MKPVVSSLVALALAIAPLSAFAKPAHPAKTAHAKPSKAKAEKTAHADKDDKEEKSEKSPVVRVVKAGKKDGIVIKNVAHHAHNVDLAGAGHKEPKSDHGGALVAASLKAPASHGKGVLKNTSAKATEMPKLPSPNAGKPSKGGSEKGARKPAEKKSDANDDSSGEPTRDEELAELVARIRGRRTNAAEPVNEVVHGEGPVTGAKAAKTSRADGRTSALGLAAAETREGSSSAKPPCAKDPVEIVRGPEIERFTLTRCDGSIAPLAIEHLSVLVRPGGAARPTAPMAELAKKSGTELAHGIRRVDPRLVDRIQSVVDHFGKPGAPAKLFVISGSRPASVGSMHASGRAIDFRVEGINNEEVVSFCKTLGDTGCGFYPNSSFVHIDVRDPGAGHVTWIDASGPGDAPRYVTTWPPQEGAARHLSRASATEPVRNEEAVQDLAEEGARLLRARRPSDRESTVESIDDHPAEKRGDD